MRPLEGRGGSVLPQPSLDCRTFLRLLESVTALGGVNAARSFGQSRADPEGGTSPAQFPDIAAALNTRRAMNHAAG